MSDFDPVQAAAQLRQQIIDDAPRLFAENERLRAEVAALRADAARYRWLRRTPQFLGWDADYRPDEIDRQVDAALAKEAK